METLSSALFSACSMLARGGGVNSKKTEFAPIGANSFLSELNPFWNGFPFREANRKSQKVVSLRKLAETYRREPMRLNTVHNTNRNNVVSVLELDVE